MLTTTYDDFMVSFNHNLDRLDKDRDLSVAAVHKLEAGIISAQTRWITGMFIRAALVVGHSLLPECVKSKYRLDTLNSWTARLVQRTLCASVWLVHSFPMVIPLRGTICLLLVLEPELRPIFRVRFHLPNRFTAPA